MIDTRSFDCDLTGAQFSKPTTPRVRFHGSTLSDPRGGQYHTGALIDPSQVLPVTLGVPSALNIAVEDEQEPPASADRGRREPVSILSLTRSTAT